MIRDLVFIAFATSAAFAAALPQLTRRSSEPHLSAIEFGISKLSAEYGSKARGKDTNVPADLQNSITWWGIELEIGTPRQKVQLQLDTGSSDMWVAGTCAGYQCSPDSTFSVEQSSSFHANLSTPFQIRYEDGTGAIGYWGQDTVSLASPKSQGKKASLNNANFAFAEYSDTSPSVLGIGLSRNEALEPGEVNYSNLPLQMKEQGIIKNVAYSLWLDPGAGTSGKGSILFGAIDTSKFLGELQTVPIVHGLPAIIYGPDNVPIPLNANGPLKEFFVVMRGIRAWGNGTSIAEAKKVVDSQYPALLDSGTTNIIFPGQMGYHVAESLGGEWSAENQNYLVDCDSTGGLEFDFSGVPITVPVKQLIDPSIAPVNGKCVFGFQYNSDNFILGDRFLSAVYTVFDLERKEISLAEAAAASSAESHLEVIDGGVPGAVQAPLYSQSGVTSIYTTLA